MSYSLDQLNKHIQEGQRAITKHQREIDRYNKMHANAVHNRDVQEARDLAAEAGERIDGYVTVSAASQAIYDEHVANVAAAKESMESALGSLTEAASAIGGELKKLPGEIGRSFMAKLKQVTTKVSQMPQIAIADWKKDRAETAIEHQTGLLNDLNSEMEGVVREREGIAVAASEIERTRAATDYSKHTEASKLGLRQTELAGIHEGLLGDISAGAATLGDHAHAQAAAQAKGESLAQNQEDVNKAAEAASLRVAESTQKVKESTKNIGKAIGNLVKGFGKTISESAKQVVSYVENTFTQVKMASAIEADQEIVDAAAGLKKIGGKRASVEELESSLASEEQKLVAALEVSQLEGQLFEAVRTLNDLEYQETQRQEASMKTEKDHETQIQARQESVAALGKSATSMFGALKNLGSCLGDKFSAKIDHFGAVIKNKVTEVKQMPGKAITGHMLGNAESAVEKGTTTLEDKQAAEAGVVSERERIATAATEIETSRDSKDYNKHTEAARLGQQQLELEATHRELTAATKEAAAMLEQAKTAREKHGDKMAGYDQELTTTMNAVMDARKLVENSNDALALATDSIKAAAKDLAARAVDVPSKLLAEARSTVQTGWSRMKSGIAGIKNKFGLGRQQAKVDALAEKAGVNLADYENAPVTTQPQTVAKAPEVAKKTLELEDENLSRV